jgi:hypothetical protein
MRVSQLAVCKELLYATLIVFSAVSLATLEFLKSIYPAADLALVRKTTVVYLIVLVQVLPALVLLSADRLIAARDNSGRRLRVFRSVLFTVALVLILRQLQLYWGPAEEFTDSLRSASFALLVLVHLIVLAAILGLAIWLFEGLVQFFLYMSPVAIVMTALLPSQVPTGENLPKTFNQEVMTATQAESQPAVFVLVFDELGYDVFLKEETLDAESFPNIAALAQDGVWFTNATTNEMASINVLPTIIDPLKSLAEHFDIRLYTHYRPLEQAYIDDCGQVMTCRGVGYLSENDHLRVAGNLASRAFYQATPEWVETAISRPMGWLLDRLGWAYPSVDRRGGHIFTKRLFSLLLDDIEGRTTLGRIHVLHLILPHDPQAFNEKGNALPSRGSYRQQSMFVDVLVGDLVSKLKREGIYDETVIAVTGDHGPRTMAPSPETPPNPAIPHVPLVIHAPGLNSDISDVDYQHVDFGPTLTDIVGLPPPDDAMAPVSGRPVIGVEEVSAFSTERPQRDKVFLVADDGGYLEFVYSDEDHSWHFSHVRHQ